jgi:hypothetical protein
VVRGAVFIHSGRVPHFQNWVNNVRIYYNTIWNPNATGVLPPTFTYTQMKENVMNADRHSLFCTAP